MRRRREPGRAIGASHVPAELCAVESPVWQSRSLTRGWLADHDLDVAAKRFDFGPLNRHDLALDAWALANGPTLELPYGNHRQAPDYAALEAAGVSRSSSSARLDEMFATAGVKVRDDDGVR